MKQQRLNQLRRLNIYSLQPYIDGAKNKNSITLKFEPPYFVVRYNGYYTDNASINNNLRKKTIIAYMRLCGAHHYIYYLKNPELRNQLYDMVNKSNGRYQLMQVLNIHNHDNLYTIHKNIPEKPTSSSSFNDEQIKLPTIASDTDTAPYLFRRKSSQEKPTLYFYKALLPQIQDYKQFQNLCYLLHILKNSGTIAVNGNIAYISFKDLTALLPNKMKRESREPRARREKLNKSFYYFLLNIQPYTSEINLCDDDTVELILSDEFRSYLFQPPYLTLNLDFINQINQHNFQFVMYFLNFLFNVSPTKPFLLKIRTQELLTKTNLLKTSTHATLNTIVKRVNNYFYLLFKYHITPRPYAITDKYIKSNTLLKLELCRFRQSKDFSPIIANLDNDTGMIMDDITQYEI